MGNTNRLTKEAQRKAYRKTEQGQKDQGAQASQNARLKREGKRSTRSYTASNPYTGEKVIVGGGEYSPGGKGRNAGTGNKSNRQQTIPKEAIAARKAKRDKIKQEQAKQKIPKVEKKEQAKTTQKTTKKSTQTIPKVENNKFADDAISNSKPMSAKDKALTAQLKSALEKSRIKENARKKYGAFESAVAGAGQALTAPASGISKIIDKIAGKDVFKDDTVTRNAENRAALARQAHSGAYGAGSLAGMMLGSYALGGGSAGASGGSSAAEAYKTAKDASMAMNGLSKQQAAIQGLKSAAKTLGVNSVKELPKDLVMDTLPRLAEVVDDPNLTNKQRVKEVAENVAVNTLFNNLSEIPGLFRIGKDVSNTFKALPASDNVAKNIEIPKLEANDYKANSFNGKPTVISQLGEQPNIEEIKRAVKQNTEAANKVLEEAKPLDEFTERALKNNNAHTQVDRIEINTRKSLLDHYKAMRDNIDPDKDIHYNREYPNGYIYMKDPETGKFVEDPETGEIMPISVDDLNRQIEIAQDWLDRNDPHDLDTLEDFVRRQREQAVSEGKISEDYQLGAREEEPPIEDVLTDYVNRQRAEAIANGKISPETGAPKTKTPETPTDARYIDNSYEWKDPALDEYRPSAKELIDGIREDIAKYSDKKVKPTTKKNLDYLEQSVDRLEQAYRTGENFDEAYEDYRKAMNRVKDNFKKTEGDNYWDKTYRQTLNPVSDENIKTRFENKPFKAEVDDNGFMKVDDDLDLPYNDMAEDTGIRKGYNIIDEGEPTIRLDATGDGSNTIPDIEVNRLTRQPEKLIGTTRERGFHNSSRTRGAIPEEIKKALNEQDSIIRNTYTQSKNWQTEDRAIELWDNVSTYDDAESQLKTLMQEHDAATVPFARRLVSAYSKSGLTEQATRVMDDVSESLTKAGQYTQAAVLGLAKDDPMTALRYAEKEIDNINEAGKKKFGKKWKDFNLSDEEKELFANIDPGDEAAIHDAFETIGKRIEKEYPSTFREQLKEATHIGMLLNPRTMSRNVIANIPTLAMRATGNRLEALGQRAGHLINKDIEVNQSILGGGKKSRALAEEAYNKPEVQALFDALDGKYNETNSISKHIGRKQMFKGENPIDKVIDGILGGYWHDDGGLITKANNKLGAEGNRSTLEALRGATYKLLELGDAPFVKENFKARLASEIKAKGWSNVDEITDDAIQRALKESLEATYKDPNRLSRLLLNIKKDTGIVGEGAIPFAQTLGSIGMRSYEYSPVGGTVALGRITKGALDQDSEAVSRGIRDLSKGLTGSAMIAAGMALYKSGVITGDYSDDPNIKEAQKRAGFKPYSIHLGDKYYTFDWMQPASVPGILGIKMAQSIENEDGMLKGLAKGGLAATDAWFDQSAFQSLAELLGGGNDTGYGDQSIAMNFVNMLTSMPQRLIPTSLGATARTIDRSYRDTYDPTSYGNNYLNQVRAKIPFLSETLPQSYDAWGQPRMRADSSAGAAFQQYINPGEYSSENMNELDQKIKAIYDDFPDKRLYPDKITNSLNVGDFQMKLNNEQHSELSRVQGGYNSELAEAMLDDEVFNSLPNENKAEMANQVYSVARDLAYQQLYGKEPTQTNEKAIAALQKGGKEGLIEFLDQSQQLDLAGVQKTDKMYNLIDKGGVDAVELYLDLKENSPKTEKGNISKPGLMKELAKLPKDQQELMYDALATNPSKAETEAYEKGGASAAIKAYNDNQEEKATKKTESKKATKKDDDKVARVKALNGTELSGEELQDQLASYGAIDSEKTVYYYNHAKQTIPSLTPQEYAGYLNKIGGSDYKITQKEMLNYGNSNHLSESEMNKYWNAFGEWKRIPVLKNGTWKAGK